MKMFIWITLLAIFPLFFAGCENNQEERVIKQEIAIAGVDDFSLTDQDNKTFHLKDHRGEIVLLFFGYLSCPDVCPTTLSRLARVYSLLEDKREKVLTVFVSVDPVRDTPSKLKEYLEYFDVRAVGLTGAQQDIDKVVNLYKATYERVDAHSAVGYLYNHTDFVYVIDQQGEVKYLFHYDDTAEDIARHIQKLLK